MSVSSTFCTLAQSQGTNSGDCRVLDSYTCVRIFFFYTVENTVLITFVQAKPCGRGS